MVLRFCLYSILKNLRFADAFLVLFLRHLGLSFAAIGTLLGYQHLLTAVLEVPLGVAADRFGRRSSLAACFACHTLSFALLARLQTPDLTWLYLALTAFGLGEALRTGSHKAIMLDYLDRRGESERATWLIGMTRSFSRFSAAFAALAGGIALYATAAYQVLFWLSAASALAATGLMLSYPRALEGEQTRARDRDRDRHDDDGQPSPGPGLGLRQRLRGLFRHAGSVPLLLQSMLFESQIKLIVKYYLQPLLKQALALMGLAVLGSGALYIGAIEAVRDSVGGVAALASQRFERAVGGARRALRRAYLLASLAAIGIAVCAAVGSLVPAVLLLIAITGLQNLRRPIFVKAFNQVMDKPQRATALSLESLSRSAFVALMLPLTGLLADSHGLWAAFVAIAIALLPGIALTPTRRSPA